jgi:hypothetical protein
MSSQTNLWPVRWQSSTVKEGRLAALGRLLYHHLWLALFPLAVPALLPFFTEGLPRSYDGGLHLLRISLLDRYLQQGMLFPRWAPELLLGHGYPVFSFYAPGTYYLVELLHLLGLDFYYAFIAGFALLILVAGGGMYWLAKDSFGHDHQAAALVAAVAYMYGPYLLTNTFIRGAIAEVGAQALLPWVFWAMRRLLYAQRPVRYLLPVAFCLGGLALTHNITLLFVPPVLVGFIGLHWWRSGRQRNSLVWALVALLAAMGVSAFFWLPLTLERRYLADTAYEIAKTVWLPGSVWTWGNFLDQGWTYTYTFDRPIRLGLVQLLLAGAGFVLARRRDGEWLYFGAVALLAGAMISSASLPLWLNSDILTVAQFTWRLLSILSLPLALFLGGLVYRVRPGWLQLAAATPVIMLVIWAHQPRLDWMDRFAPATTDLSLPVFLQVEVDKDVIEGGAGNSSIQEFRPRWADETLELIAPPEEFAAAAVTIHRANAFAIEASVLATATTTLRFNDYYFPGWQVLLNGSERLQPYPSTNLGLLTVDLPAGHHNLSVHWQGTRLQQWSGWLSLLTLLGLAGFLARQPSLRLWSLVPALCLIFGVTATGIRPALDPVRAPAQPLEAEGVRLLGLRWEVQAEAVDLYPFWQVVEPPRSPLRTRWQLLDPNGRVQVDVISYPYFNSYQASNFPLGAIIDDAYRIPLPPGLAAGDYWVALGVGDTFVELREKPIIIGKINLPEPIPNQPEPRQRVHVVAGDQIRLVGFDLTIRGRPLVATHRHPAVVRPGSYLDYHLYWQALRPITKNYHGFVHLVDAGGRPLAQQDQLPGPFFQPPPLWSAYRHVSDIYHLRIPPDATSGLYWPAVGMYDFDSQQRLPLTVDEQSDLGYDYRLPPIKVLNPPQREPEHKRTIELGTLGTLIGFDLDRPIAEVRPGESFQVTLYYRAGPTSRVNYTRFLHLHDEQRGMAAQQDGPPQDGLNPTWVWQPGEVVADAVTLVVPPETPPGEYRLYTGFYNAVDGVRLTLSDGGQPVPDDRAPLLTLTIKP